MVIQLLRSFLPQRSTKRIASRLRRSLPAAICRDVGELEDRLLLMTQSIAPTQAAISAAPGQQFEFGVTYNSINNANNAPVNTFALRMFFDSSQFTFDGFKPATLLAENRQFPSTSADLTNLSGFTFPDTDNLDATSNSGNTTDFYTFTSWGDPNAGFPANLPDVSLFVAQFTPTAAFMGASTIHFNASATADGFTFSGTDVVVTPAAANAAPVISSAATASAAENQTSAYTVTATDADATDTLTFAISGGADAALFNIVAATGVVTFKTAPDFEAPADAGANNIYNIQVTANDGTVNSAAQNVAITVTDVTEVVPNSAPVISSAATASAAENQTAAYTVTATDADATDTLTYVISGGADAALFNIVAATGVVTFKTAPDFEAPADAGANNVYDIQVTANDGTVNSAAQNVAITVTDVTEVVANSAPVISSAATASAAENQTAAYTATATDADATDTLTYAISGGADAGLFNIVAATGVVTFKTAPDFEAPADAGANNIYNIQVTANDGTVNSAAQNVAITVTDVTEVVPNSAPVISSAATSSAAENQTAAYTVTATDADATDTLTFAISGGADAVLFNIDAATGVVTFKTAPDFEAPADAGANNIYNIQVTANDGTVNSAAQNVAITVTDVTEVVPNSAPVISSAATSSAAENQTAAYTVTATDADATDTLTFAISGGADAALFNIVAATGVVAFKTAPDFEAPADAGANNVYNIQVTANDGTVNSATRNVAITVTDVNDTVTGNGTIQGRKWNDANANGIRDTGESWLNGWTIQLVNAGGTVVSEQVTSSIDINGDGQIDPITESGVYRFDIQAGTYTVREVLQTGWIQTSPQDELAARATQVDNQLNLETANSTFENWGGLGEKWLMGSGSQWYFITPNGELFEWNGSGRSNLTGVQVELFSTAFFEDVSLLTDPEQAQIAQFAVTAGGVTNGPDFGNFNSQALGSIAGRKLHDLNGNGQADPGETWLNNWVIELVDGSGQVVSTTTTMDVDRNGDGTIDAATESGWYEFADVGVGTWYVREQLPDGWKQSNADSAAQQAFDLSTELGLRTTGNLFENWGGRQERWIHGNDSWYFITPNGNLHKWDGNPRTNLTGTVVAQFPGDYFSDVTLLTDAVNPAEVRVNVQPGQEAIANLPSRSMTDVAVTANYTGNVSVRTTARGRLIVTGDNASNGVQITRNSDGFITLIGLGQTTIMGASSHTLTGWTQIPEDLRASLGNGNDALILDDVVVGRNVYANMERGDDSLMVLQSDISGNLDYRSNWGENIVYLGDSNVGNLTRIIGGTGSDTVVTNRMTAGGRAVVSLRGGADQLGIEYTSINGNVRVLLGSGNDSLVVGDGTTLSGNLAVVNGAGGSDDISAGTNSSAAGIIVRRFDTAGGENINSVLDGLMSQLAERGLDGFLNN